MSSPLLLGLVGFRNWGGCWSGTSRTGDDLGRLDPIEFHSAFRNNADQAVHLFHTPRVDQMDSNPDRTVVSRESEVVGCVLRLLPGDRTELIAKGIETAHHRVVVVRCAQFLEQRQLRLHDPTGLVP